MEVISYTKTQVKMNIYPLKIKHHPMKWLFAAILYVYDSGLFIQKMCMSFVIAGTFQFFTTYIFNDVTFGKFLTAMILLDTITGIWKTIKANPDSPYRGLTKKKFQRMVEKVFYYLCTIMVITLLVNFKANEKVSFLNKIDFQQIGLSAIIINEAMSVLVNLYAIKKYKFLVYLFNKINLFKSEEILENTQENN